MTSYKDLLKQREALEAQIHAARKSELSEAIAKARALVDEYELTAEDIFRSIKKASTMGSKVPAKYRNQATGETWTGRGKPPAWIKDQNREVFTI